MSRASVFLFSLGVGVSFVATVVGGCSSSPVTQATGAEAGSPGPGGGLSAVTDGDDAGSAPDDAGSNGGGGGDVAPTPLLASIAPTFAAVGALGPTLVVKGTSFTAKSVVRVDGTELTTTYFSDSELHAALPNAKLGVATVLHISVKTPAPGGGTSQDLPFEVRNPVAALTALDPGSALAGASDTPFTLTGSSFAPSAAVYFDGTALTALSASDTTIATTIPSALLKVSGSHNVTIVNPSPGGGTSNALAFTVTNPNVVVSSVSPSTGTVGDGAKTLSVVGTGFVGATSLSFNGTTLSSTFGDSTHMTATLPASLLVAAGNFPVVATNPAPGGGVSAPANFQVQNPIPAIANVSPNTVFYGANDTNVTVTGTGFVSSSVVKLGASSLTTTYVSSTSLSAVVPASAFASLGTLSLTVVTPAPGGGTSNAAQLFVGCDSTGVDVPLGAVGTITTRNTFYPSTYVNHVPSAACPLTALSGFQEPTEAFVVQNTTTSNVVLSAWAVCSVNGSAQTDGFLAFYRGGVAPADDTSRLACASGTVVSEGALGAAGNYTSPDANGSNWCPGLTKGNGSGLTLAACEKAVVTVTPYSTTAGSNYPPPAQMRFEPEAP